MVRSGIFEDPDEGLKLSFLERPVGVHQEKPQDEVCFCEGEVLQMQSVEPAELQPVHCPFGDCGVQPVQFWTNVEDAKNRDGQGNSSKEDSIALKFKHAPENDQLYEIGREHHSRKQRLDAAKAAVQ